MLQTQKDLYMIVVRNKGKKTAYFILFYGIFNLLKYKMRNAYFVL
jgi:hypothetical protein